MGRWHIDEECESALIRLNDALCTFERNTGRQYTLILVPQTADEQVHLSQSGKPLPPDLGMSPREVLEIALRDRGDG